MFYKLKIIPTQNNFQVDINGEVDCYVYCSPVAMSTQNSLDTFVFRNLFGALSVRLLIDKEIKKFTSSVVVNNMVTSYICARKMYGLTLEFIYDIKSQI